MQLNLEQEHSSGVLNCSWSKQVKQTTNLTGCILFHIIVILIAVVSQAPCDCFTYFTQEHTRTHEKNTFILHIYNFIYNFDANHWQIGIQQIHLINTSLKIPAFNHCLIHIGALFCCSITKIWCWDTFLIEEVLPPPAWTKVFQVREQVQTEKLSKCPLGNKSCSWSGFLIGSIMVLADCRDISDGNSRALPALLSIGGEFMTSTRDLLRIWKKYFEDLL